MRESMAKIDKVLIQKLRTITGLGMMDCKKALEQFDGNVEKAVEELRKKGAVVAAKRADKETAQGRVQSYIHPGDQVGVMVELNCETDFVANTDDVKKFAKNLCLHIAAMRPLYLNKEEVDPKFLEHEKNIMMEQLKDSGKPEALLSKIVDGKVNKLYSEVCLLNQPLVMNDQLTVDQALKELIAKTGENIKIKRFARFEIGR